MIYGGIGGGGRMMKMLTVGGNMGVMINHWVTGDVGWVNGSASRFTDWIILNYLGIVAVIHGGLIPVLVDSWVIGLR